MSDTLFHAAMIVILFLILLVVYSCLSMMKKWDKISEEDYERYCKECDGYE